jgi:hypothetical protein
MTRAFDLSAIGKPDLFDLLLDEISLDKVEVRRVPVKEIRRAVVTGHYSGVMPDATQDAFGAYQDEKLVAAVAYGPGGNSRSLSAIIEGIDNTSGRELIRLWVHPDAPKNTASYTVSKSLKLLPKEVELVVSFADSGQNHAGYVYQALNFYYLGMSNEGVRYVDTTGTEVTARLANVYRTRNPDKFADKSLSDIRQELGWTAIKSHAKHRYALGINKGKRTINRQLALRALPFPKLQDREKTNAGL